MAAYLVLVLAACKRPAHGVIVFPAEASAEPDPPITIVFAGCPAADAGSE